jgi:hypothetical protein
MMKFQFQFQFQFQLPGQRQSQCRREGLVVSLLLLLACSSHISHSSTTVGAFLVQSQGSGGWGTGLARDPQSNKLIVVGTTFADSFWDVTVKGKDSTTTADTDTDTDCFVAIGDAPTGEFTRQVLQAPELCVGGTVVLKHQGYGVAVVVGPSSSSSSSEEGTQNVLQTLDYFANVVTPGFSQPYTLPAQTIPVATAPGETSFLFIGLHDTRGHVYTHGSTNTYSSGNALQALLTFWKSMSEPEAIAATSSSPQVLKINAITGSTAFQVELTASTGSATISEMLQLSNTAVTGNAAHLLIVAGSTNGSGNAFGTAAAATTTDALDADWDGYVTFLDPMTGDLALDSSGVAHVRIASQAGKDDHVTSLCVSETGTGNNEHLFIVGTTQGIVQGIHAEGAFVMKMDLETREIIWKVQMSGDQVEGLACTVSESTVFLGGATHVDLDSNANTKIPSQTPDAFIAAVDVATGQVQWIQQLDTSLEEGDSRTELIVDMDLNPLGNVVVLLNSMNLEKGLNDIFLLDLNKDTGANDLGLLKSDHVIPTLGDEGEEDEERAITIVAIVLPVVLAFLVFGISWMRHQTEIETVSQSTKEGAQQPEHEVL